MPSLHVFPFVDELFLPKTLVMLSDVTVYCIYLNHQDVFVIGVFVDIYEILSVTVQLE